VAWDTQGTCLVTANVYLKPPLGIVGGGWWRSEGEAHQARSTPWTEPEVIGLGAEAPDAEYISIPDSQFRLHFAHKRSQYSKKSVGLPVASLGLVSPGAAN